MQVNQSIGLSTLKEKEFKATNNFQKNNLSNSSELCSSSVSSAFKAHNLVGISFKQNNENLNSTLNQLANPEFSRQLIQSIVNDKTVSSKEVLETKQKISSPGQYLKVLHFYEIGLDKAIKELKLTNNKSAEQKAKLVDLKNIKTACNGIDKLITSKENGKNIDDVAFAGDKAKMVKAAGTVVEVGAALVGLGVALFCPAVLPVVAPIVGDVMMGAAGAQGVANLFDKEDED